MRGVEREFCLRRGPGRSENRGSTAYAITANQRRRGRSTIEPDGRPTCSRTGGDIEDRVVASTSGSGPPEGVGVIRRIVRYPRLRAVVDLHEVDLGVTIAVGG